MSGLPEDSTPRERPKSSFATSFASVPGETVIVTADTASDRLALEAILAAAAAAGSQSMLILIPQLPYQGKLADPYIPEALASAVAASDVWFDLTFPYLAGSSTHDRR